jgi:hypothetical protein
MKLLAIDPGPTESAWVEYDPDRRMPGEWTKEPNWKAIDRISDYYDGLAVEMIASYGMAVGAEVFETCVWVGRFLERWASQTDGAEATRVFRREVKLHLCGSARAKDANIRQALIDRYGGKEKAIGKKASPGPLYGMSGDCWSALAVAVTAAEVGVLAR